MCVEERLGSGNLLQRISDAIKRPFYSGAGGPHGDDDRDRNSSSDETILDGGRARVVSQLCSATLSSDLNQHLNFY